MGKVRSPKLSCILNYIYVNIIVRIYAKTLKTDLKCILVQRSLVCVTGHEQEITRQCEAYSHHLGQKHLIYISSQNQRTLLKF